MPRSAWCTVVLALGAATAFAACLQAQEPTPQCVAVDPTPFGLRTRWFDAQENEIYDTTPQTPDALARRFAGTYSLLVVTSEGKPEKLAAEYVIHFSKPRADQLLALDRIPTAPGTFVVPVEATVDFVRSVVVWRNEVGPWHPEISGPMHLVYSPSEGTLRFNQRMGLDTGTFFLISEVKADGSFAGRWTDGDLLVTGVETRLGDLVEQERGYFCASPRSH